MYAVLTVVRYPTRFIYFAICAMALFRMPLARNKQFLFYKLLGCGKNGSFDIHPDWNQWAIIVFINESPNLDAYKENADLFYRKIYGSFIANWWRRFNCETWTISLELMEGHGSWNGQKLSPVNKINTTTASPIAVLTRATIRLHKLRDFWKNVEPVARQMKKAQGLITSLGVGEMPFIRQATFSIWESPEDMKKFAYSMQEHREVIKKTRKENWYSEDMFLRFRPISSLGSLKGLNPWPGH